MLDLDRLENAKRRAGKVIGRCPACAEAGGDTSGDHLVILDDGAGRFGCVAYPGPDGHAHRQRIAELLGMRDDATRLRAPVRPRPTPPPAPRRPRLDLALTTPSITDMAIISSSRGWPFFAGLEIAYRRGIFFTTKVWDAAGMVPAWVITDSSRHAAQARRMDGRPWVKIEAKAKTLPQSCASWPVGSAEIADRPIILLCEGGPDMLAAMTTAWLLDAAETVAPVAMLGAGMTIHPAALDYFRGKRVRIIEQNDPAARQAGLKWFHQLRTVASSVDGFEPPAEDKDLSDTLTRLSREHEDPDQLAEALRQTGFLDGINLNTNNHAR